jgi:ABC-type multidrug transport system fused ATPase/permease subunit
MKKAAKHFKGYIKETILSPLFKLCEASLELIVPLVIASIIDTGIANSDTRHIINMCLVLVMLGVVGLTLSLIAQYFAAKSAVGFTTSLKKSLFSHLEELSYKDIDTIGTSTIITRMTTDSSRVQSGINLTLRLLLRSPFVVFGAMIMAFTIDVKSGVGFAVTIPVLSIVVFGIMAITTPLHGRVQACVDKILSRTRENLSGARVIRAFAMEDSESDNFQNENSTLTISQKKAGHISALLNPLTYVIINLGILSLIYTGALQVNSGNLTQGQVIALYNYMSQILVELIKLANLIVTISKALASLKRINSIMDTESTQNFGNTTEGDRNCDTVLEMSGVALKYSNASENALSNINFSVKRGETVGIIGGTGSGKTSLISLIPRLYDATEGCVKLFGINIADYAKEFLNDTISIVPQKSVLFSGSIRDNLKWRKNNASDYELLAAIKIAQATDVMDNKGGLDGKIEAEGKNLSGGQRQRLAIARALVGNPKILILDDSASALDYATDARLRKAISNLANETTVFIVSQRAASVIDADKIIVLDDGEISAIGTHNELLNSSDVYREIYDSQFEEVKQNG